MYCGFELHVTEGACRHETCHVVSPLSFRMPLVTLGQYNLSATKVDYTSTLDGKMHW